MISSLYMGDYVSIYKANLDKFNPIETKLIKELKEELSTQNTHHSGWLRKNSFITRD
jgi:hypothetical protein